MTLYEYGLQIKAAHLREADRLSRAAKQAMYNRQATLSERRGDKMVYKITSASEIYDLSEAEKIILGYDEKAATFARLRGVAKRLKQYREDKS